MDLKDMGWDARNCMCLAVDRDKWRAYVRASSLQPISQLINMNTE